DQCQSRFSGLSQCVVLSEQCPIRWPKEAGSTRELDEEDMPADQLGSLTRDQAGAGIVDCDRGRAVFRLRDAIVNALPLRFAGSVVTDRDEIAVFPADADAGIRCRKTDG